MDPNRPTHDVQEQGSSEEDLPLPTGTLFFMMIFLMVMAGMWMAIYFDYLGR